MGKDEAIVKAIIEAAKTRFEHYGYAKTTMAELARDCDMSPGNLYRYFPGKLDIAAHIAEERSAVHFARLRGLLDLEGMSYAEKLRLYHFEELRLTYHILATTKRTFEMIQHIREERPDFAAERQAVETEILVDLLRAGVKAGEFNVEELEFTAEAIMSATMKFKYAQLFSSDGLGQLERELNGVMQLILAGLVAPGPHARQRLPDPVLDPGSDLPAKLD